MWIRQLARRLAVLVIMMGVSAVAAGDTHDVDMPAGANFDKASFRLWVPDGLARVRAVLVLVPGSNGDGRAQVEDADWRELATKRDLALVGLYMTDREHDDMFIEHYIEVNKGSGDTFLSALSQLGERAGHPEVASAPLLLWGMSAGGEFNYEMALWKPERVAGFVVNKGGIYYSALASKAAREVPGLFFIGEEDLAFRNDIIRGIYSVNRRAQALWALVEEPGVAHRVARSKEMAMMFYEEILELRVTGASLARLDPERGFICDPATNICGPAAGAPERTYPTAWLPAEELTRLWLAITMGKPFEATE